MSQEITKAIEQANQALRVFPLDCAAQRATTFEVRFDGGAFTFHVYELRESTEARLTSAVAKWELHEVARYAISPVAFSRLRDAMGIGEGMYTAVMGRPVITDAENTKHTMDFIQKSMPAAPKK